MAQIRAVGPRGRGQRYPGEIRNRVLEHLTRRLAGGGTIVAAARELGLSRKTLYGWREDAAGLPGADALVPVVVRERPAPSGERLVVFAAGGLRIEGDTDQSLN